ncbi:MAG: hypothetical protein EBY26_00265 [Microbacteriaceae bacterium]|nr:hypothetical protein [Microbacteriaceae bacterium]
MPINNTGGFWEKGYSPFSDLAERLLKGKGKAAARRQEFHAAAGVHLQTQKNQHGHEKGMLKQMMSDPSHVHTQGTYHPQEGFTFTGSREVQKGTTTTAAQANSSTVGNKAAPGKNSAGGINTGKSAKPAAPKPAATKPRKPRNAAP